MRQLINKYKWIVIILCILVGIYFLWPIISDEGSEMPDTKDIGYNHNFNGHDNVNRKNETEEQQEGIIHIQEQQSTSTDINKSLVYITGAVQSPGLYKVPQQSSIGDVIKIAGGVLPYGDVESINMAHSITSGEHIHVAFNFKGNPETLLKPQKININTASIKELDSLPGIGPAMAKRIDEYRQSKGAFTSIEDIKQVKGIGDGLFKKISDKITV